MVKIVTDSTSDVEAARARELGIAVVPLFVNFGAREFLDRVDLDLERFHALLASEAVLPTTTQPSAAMFEETFAPLVAAGHPIVGLFISHRLSGTLNSAKAAAARFQDARIEIVDSLSATAGLGLQVERAAELARDGASVETVLAAAERDRARQHGYATLPDLTHVVRTGRIGKARGAIGTLLRIVPVLQLKDGEITEEARVRTFGRAQEAIVEATLRELGDVRRARVRVLHSHAPECAAVLLEMLRAKLGTAPERLDVAEAGPVIGVHVGPGAVGIFSIAG
ncbi:MAG: DegV family protein [Candidatus Baltobacteraceae bacterium]